MVYPNPAGKEVHINYQMMDGSTAIRFEITDINGRTLKTVENDYSSGDVIVNTEDLADGLYLIKITKVGLLAACNRLLVMKRD